MKAELLLLFPFAGLLMAGPARRDCGMTNSFIGTNSCGETYGGSWVECATGIVSIQTFAVPTCSPSLSTEPAAKTETDFEIVFSTTTTTTTTSESGPIITAAPNYDPTSVPEWDNGTTSCYPVWLYIDYLVTCGTTETRYGGYINTCSPSSISSPPCTMPPVSRTTTKLVRPSTTTDPGFAEPTDSGENDWCQQHPWMCMPEGWL